MQINTAVKELMVLAGYDITQSRQIGGTNKSETDIGIRPLSLKCHAPFCSQFLSAVMWNDEIVDMKTDCLDISISAVNTIRHLILFKVLQSGSLSIWITLKEAAKEKKNQEVKVFPPARTEQTEVLQNKTGWWETVWLQTSWRLLPSRSWCSCDAYCSTI